MFIVAFFFVSEVMSAVVAYARLFPPQVTMAVSYSDQEEVSGIKDVGHALELRGLYP